MKTQPICTLRSGSLRCNLLFIAGTLLLAFLSCGVNIYAQSQESQLRESWSTTSLDGDWEFRQEGQSDWKTIQIPNPFELHEGPAFNGVGWYRKRLNSIPLEAHESVFVRFQGSATETKVWCNGTEVGSHLGGWTPFDIDLTPWMRAESPETAREVELLVRVDELVGHNSQGFLPVFAPHFGGLWQGVTLHRTSAWRIDTKSLFAWGDSRKNAIRLQIPIELGLRDTTAPPSVPIGVQLRYRKKQDRSKTSAGNPSEVSDAPWSEFEGLTLDDSEIESLRGKGRLLLEVEIPVSSPELWSPETPNLYEVEIHLVRRIFSKVSDSVVSIDRAITHAAFRTVNTRDQQLLLNDQPLRVRGILNWGWAPPSTAPSLDPDVWRKELELVKSHGFNLMKFCLWIPPKGYLELADELGVLVWMEYPTWHSQWTPDQLPKLEREFDEFFHYDRVHPSVILRSLTCETGPSADIGVIRALYDRCHTTIPGSIVEDDSSWIQWNRVHDFYDDHPYGNNHTWVETLDRLKHHIDKQGHKPLVLGEAIAADTWVDPSLLEPVVGAERPFWLPQFLDANKSWLEQRARDMGQQAIERVPQDSLDYASRMRKYQIEAYHREVPDGGYVVSVIRDFPFAGMGLVDFLGRNKWNAKDWAWHGDSMLLLQTPNDHRGFYFDEPFTSQFLLSQNGRAGDSGNSSTAELELRLTLENPSTGSKREISRHLPAIQEKGEDGGSLVRKLAEIKLQLMDLANEASSQPQRITIAASLLSNGKLLASNQWNVWGFARPEKLNCKLSFHSSCDASNRERLQSLTNPPLLGETLPDVKTPEVESPEDKVPEDKMPEDKLVVIARRFDSDLLDQLELGALVYMIPDGEVGSLPLKQHWFLRGGPIVTSHHATWNAMHPMLIELQHFDLSSRVLPDLQWLDQLEPLVMLWDNHDIETVQTHGLIVAARMGRGILMVNAIDSEPRSHKTPAGDFVTRECVNWLLRIAKDSDHTTQLPSLSSDVLTAMRDKLTQQTIPLTPREWSFRIDPDNQGLELGWHLSPAPDPSEWKPMQIGKHWESLGYPALDGWAWYRIDVELPEDWRSREIYVWVDGGDDYFEVYADGEKIGSAGDIATKSTAFEERVSFAVPLAKHRPAEVTSLSLAIRVFDWYGSGGLFRPIQLSTSPRRKSLEILR